MLQQRIRLDFRTAALDLAGVSGDLGLRYPKQSDTLNPRTARNRVQGTVTSLSPFHSVTLPVFATESFPRLLEF
jgi:hypothetical protein